MQTDGPDDMTDTTPMDIADRLLASLNVKNPHLLRIADIAEAANEIKRLRAARGTTPPQHVNEEIAEMVEAWHQEFFGLRIDDRKLGELQRRIATLFYELATRATPPVSEEQIASAIDSVHLFSRVNDLLTPPQIEICRYGSDDEDEIVVVSSHDTKWKEHDLLRNAVRDARARAG